MNHDVNFAAVEQQLNTQPCDRVGNGRQSARELRRALIEKERSAFLRYVRALDYLDFDTRDSIETMIQECYGKKIQQIDDGLNPYDD